MQASGGSVIVAALILQALVFGAGHANYPTQPSYARVVELFLPAVFWGVLYLAYGLIPVIVLHVTFDAVYQAIERLLVANIALDVLP